MNASKLFTLTLLTFLFITVINEHNDNDWDHHQSSNTTNGTTNNRTKVYITDKRIQQKWVTLAAKAHLENTLMLLTTNLWTTWKLTCSWGRGGLYSITSWSGWVLWGCDRCPITNWGCCTVTETSDCCISIQMGKRRILNMQIS